MFFKHIIDGYFEDSIGESGIKHAEFNAMFESSTSFLSQLEGDALSGKYPLFSSDINAINLDEIQSIADEIKSNFKNVVILGTGGSSLCGNTLTGFNEIERKFSQQSPEIFFMDNVDPESFKSLLDNINLGETCFIAISKSGATLETISQFTLCYQAVISKTGAENAAKNFYIISDPSENPLRNIGQDLGIKILDHEPNIGGRFSILSNVGLLPAAIAGLDINKIRSGATTILKQNFDKPDESECLKGAVLNVLLAQKNYHITVFMPYIDRFKNLSNWFRQIWSESLGKDGHGTTPVNAMGSIDQHSQLQLYLGGANDKIYSFVTLKNHDNYDKINSEFLNTDTLSYINNHSLGDVISASYFGTKEALIQHNRPVRIFELQRLDEEILGAMVMHLILETVLCGYIMGINPFDQLAVEKSKIITKKLLREGASTK